MAGRTGALENMGVNPDFWTGKTVLVTGHTGFKGGWLSLWLQEMGSRVVGYALDPPTTPSLFDIARVGDGMSSIIGDIRDLERLRCVITEYKPDILLHLAAQSLVRSSYADPVETYSTNVMGTVHVLEAARLLSGLRVVLNVTSDKCYENKEWHRGYRENEPIGGHDPYSSSKGCAELVTAAFRSSFFSNGNSRAVALASARAGNVIGGGDWSEDRLVPDAVRAFVCSRPLRVRYPDAVRPWQHVLEPLAGYLTLCEKLWHEPGHYAEPWNFGPIEDGAKPVSFLVQVLAEQWGENVVWEPDNGTHPQEAHCLRLDVSKACARLGWQPRWSLDQALAKTVAWYKAWQAGQDMRAFTLGQIDAYRRQAAA